MGGTVTVPVRGESEHFRKRTPTVKKLIDHLLERFAKNFNSFDWTDRSGEPSNLSVSVGESDGQSFLGCKATIVHGGEKLGVVIVQYRTSGEKLAENRRNWGRPLTCTFRRSDVLVAHALA